MNNVIFVYAFLHVFSPILALAESSYSAEPYFLTLRGTPLPSSKLTQPMISMNTPYVSNVTITILSDATIFFLLNFDTFSLFFNNLFLIRINK